MKKISEDIEEKYSEMMCDFEKILTLIKLFKEMQYENSEFSKADLHNICSILYHQTSITCNKMKEIDNLINK